MSLVDDILIHYGMPRRSGRYPWGSGDNPYQHSGDFLARVDELKKSNYTYTDEDGKTYTGEVAIAKGMGLSTTQLRIQISLAKDERRADDVATAKSLREKGYSLNEIAEKMGFTNDSSVRSLLDTHSEARMNQAKTTAELLKKAVDEKGMIDVGTGVEKELNISKEKLNEALYILEMEGYNTFGGGVPQVTNKGRQTNIRVLCPPDTPYKVNEKGVKVSSAIYDFENVHSVRDYVSHDGGETYDPKWVYPKSMDINRLQICYADQGGLEKDGVIEIRRGVEDLSLGESHYAQVRILVDNDKYLKGMAVYADDLPDGIDVRFNTNKTSDKSITDVLKPIKNDPNNPFGSLIKEGIVDPDKSDAQEGGQSYYYDKNGNKQLSLINKRAEEGDWGEWADKLPSQFLSKQSLQLVEKQLNLASSDKVAEFDEISSLTNPVVKKSLLKSFADDCDSAAEHLQAAALPRQKYQVILPVNSLKDNEIYAPNYTDGETVALVRYPHGGTFEIPILKVNNKQKDARKMLGTNPVDAVGINKNVAARLSGADFDGDTVMVIPCNSSSSKVHITSTRPFEELENFDNKLEYGPDSSKPVRVDEATGKEYYTRNGKTYQRMNNTQKEMGVISNLITDMTLKGATEDELIRAVKHSMVVIDAEKHKLDYKQSEKDNAISSLKKKYQGRIDENGKYHEGASTLISRAKSETSVLKRQGSPTIDPETGENVWKVSDNLTYVNKKTGETITRTQPSTQMAEAKDAFSLVSEANTPVERAYATYANKMKSLANQARLEILATPKISYDSSAKETYKTEVASLNSKLNVSLMNAPRERQAQLMANTVVNAKKQANPDLTKKEIKKISQQALMQARNEVGAKRTTIEITDKEWAAIQAGAISENVLTQIVNHANIDTLRQRAMPRTTTTLSAAKQAKIAAMSASGYTTSEIAKAVGVSSNTVLKYLK